jgi:hypothetical protein
MTGHTLATGRAATLIKLAFAAGAKLSAAFIAFGLTALVTRNMPSDESGIFLLCLSFLAVYIMFLKFCLENVRPSCVISYYFNRSISREITGIF